MLIKPIIPDRTGFPMIFIQEMDLYVQWYPITKVQFERLINEIPLIAFREGLYQSLLDLNPRIAPQKIAPNNYWNLFLTGILPAEAEMINDAFGEQYFIPDEKQWRTLYDALSPRNDFLTLPDEFVMHERDRRIYQKMDPKNLNLTRGSNTQSGQLFLSDGVMEWVRSLEGKSTWVGMGKPMNKEFFLRSFKKPNEPDPINNADKIRRRYYGMRLFYKP